MYGASSDPADPVTDTAKGTHVRSLGAEEEDLYVRVVKSVIMQGVDDLIVMGGECVRDRVDVGSEDDRMMSQTRCSI